MLFTYMTYSAYELYVALLDALISVAVALSVVVSLDRVFHVMKYVQLKMRARVTGRKPEEYYQFNALPDLVRRRPHPASHSPRSYIVLRPLNQLWTDGGGLAPLTAPEPPPFPRAAAERPCLCHDPGEARP